MPGKKRRGGRNLTAGQRRELGRMNESRWSLSSFLGRQSEEAAKEVCQKLQEVINLWCIPKNSSLDHKGVDIVCETARGFWLLNVKKSSAGIDQFYAEREKLKQRGVALLPTYPWAVGLRHTDKETAKKELEQILNKTPSFSNELPEDIKQELINPTYQTKTTKTPIAAAEPAEKKPEESLTDLKDKFQQLGRQGVFINQITLTEVWEARLSARINNVPIEIVCHASKRSKAERKAYEELLKKCGRS